jgi:type IV secretory pathway VirB10-like protein
LVLYRRRGDRGFCGVLLVHGWFGAGGAGKHVLAAGWREGLCSMHLAGRRQASLVLNAYRIVRKRGQMKKSPRHLLQALLLLLAAGCVLPALAQDAGPMPPPPPASAAAPAPAPANQPAAQKPHDGSGGAPASGGSAAPGSAADGATTAGAAAVPAVAANGANSGADTSGALAAPGAPAAATAPVVAPSAKIMVPAGTHIPLVLHNAVSTRSARPGDAVYFETLFPVMIDGKVVIPAGSYVCGEVT